MNDDRAGGAHPLVEETQQIWDAKATHWDSGMGEGNLFQTVLVGPSAERLLNLQPGETVLDVACGNGVFSRKLAELGALVVATDFSQTFLDLAATRTTANRERIEYRLVDATDEAQILSLGAARFDAIVCNMALMDMPVIEPLLNAARQILKPAGRFVFTVQHPAFNSNAVFLGAEEGPLETQHFIRLSNYLDIPPGKGIGMPGEPEPHWYFHRPLHELLGACFAAGFVLDGLEEPAFAPEHASSRTLSWVNFIGIPPVLAARLRLA